MSDDSPGRYAMSVTAAGGAAVRAARWSAPRRRDRACTILRGFAARPTADLRRPFARRASEWRRWYWVGRDESAVGVASNAGGAIADATVRRSPAARRSARTASVLRHNSIGAIVSRPSSGTLPFSCPFGAPRSGKGQQGSAQGEGRKSAEPTRDEARSGSVQQTAAKGG